MAGFVPTRVFARLPDRWLRRPSFCTGCAATDLAGGQIPVSVQSLPSALPFLQSGKIKVLGVVNQKRLASLPNVPTIGETLPGFGSTPWYGLLAPAGTPKDIIDKLQAAIAKTLASKDVIDKLAAQGCEVLTGSPADRKSTRLNSSHPSISRMPSSA